MSGIAKGIKKAFKKVVKVVKQIIKPIAIAAAVYFTAGVALSFIPATQAFAATLPGFAGGGWAGLGIGASKVAGEGIFSTVASTIGLGGGLAKGAAEVAAGSVGLAASGGAAGSTGASLFPTTATVAAGDTAGVLAGMNTGAALAPTMAAAPGLAAAGMSLTDKLLMAKVGTDVAGALFGPSPEEEYAAAAEAQAKFYGSFYGMDAQGNTAPGPTSSASAQSQPQAGAPGVSSRPQAPNVAPAPPPLFAEKGPAPAAANTDPYARGPMQQNIQAPSHIAAPTPGVRYA